MFSDSLGGVDTVLSKLRGLLSVLSICVAVRWRSHLHITRRSPVPSCEMKTGYAPVSIYVKCTILIYCIICMHCILVWYTVCTCIHCIFIFSSSQLPHDAHSPRAQALTSTTRPRQTRELVEGCHQRAPRLRLI